MIDQVGPSASNHSGEVRRHPPPTPATRRAAARALAAAYDGVLSRRLLATGGYDPDAIAREIRADRWVRQGRQTIGLHTGPLSGRWVTGSPPSTA